MALSNLSFSTDPLWINWDNNVIVQVSNNGTVAESITLHLKANEVEQSSQTFSLASGASVAKTFTWNPSTIGARSMKVVADAVTGETDLGNNSVGQSVDVLDSTDGTKFAVTIQNAGNGWRCIKAETKQSG